MSKMHSRWRRVRAIPDQIEQTTNLLKSIDQRMVSDRWIEIRERCINIERKIDELVRFQREDFKGYPDQRYGHLSYSQHGEDMVFIALFELLEISSPSFLDIGANHPVNCNNTALLRSRCGSRGVNIDANPDAIELFKRERPEDINVNIGVAGKPGELTFYRFDSTSGRNSFSKAAIEAVMSSQPYYTIQDEIIVPVLTLDQVIDTYLDGQCPDLLSLDAEGMDYEILEAATFRSRPKVLCVETLSGEGDAEKAMDDLIKSKGFRKYVQMYANAIYLDDSIKI